MLKCLYVAHLLLLPVLVNFYFRFAYAVKIVSTRVTGLSAYENMDYTIWIFPPAARLTRVTLETCFRHLELWGALRFLEKFGGH